VRKRCLTSGDKGEDVRAKAVLKIIIRFPKIKYSLKKVSTKKLEHKTRPTKSRCLAM